MFRKIGPNQATALNEVMFYENQAKSVTNEELCFMKIRPRHLMRSSVYENQIYLHAMMIIRGIYVNVWVEVKETKIYTTVR